MCLAGIIILTFNGESGLILEKQFRREMIDINQVIIY